MATLFLLTTDGCHLCQQAYELCRSMQLDIELVDIIEDDELVNHYGDKIPVLMAEGAEQALFWPFDGEQIKQYMSFYGISKNY